MGVVVRSPAKAFSSQTPRLCDISDAGPEEISETLKNISLNYVVLPLLAEGQSQKELLVTVTSSLTAQLSKWEVDTEEHYPVVLKDIVKGLQCLNTLLGGDCTAKVIGEMNAFLLPSQSSTNRASFSSVTREALNQYSYYQVLTKNWIDMAGSILMYAPTVQKLTSELEKMRGLQNTVNGRASLLKLLHDISSQAPTWVIKLPMDLWERVLQLLLMTYTGLADEYGKQKDQLIVGSCQSSVPETCQIIGVMH